jgi:hypothetical protein
MGGTGRARQDARGDGGPEEPELSEARLAALSPSRAPVSDAPWSSQLRGARGEGSVRFGIGAIARPGTPFIVPRMHRS